MVYTGVLVDLAYLKEWIENRFLVVSFTRKKIRHFQRSVKQHTRLNTWHQRISSWKIITIQFNFAFEFIDWMPTQAHRQKKFAGAAVFALPPQPNDALQHYSILRLGYRSVRFLDSSVPSVYTGHIAIQSVQKTSQHWVLSFTETHHHDNRRMSG